MVIGEVGREDRVRGERQEEGWRAIGVASEWGRRNRGAGEWGRRGEGVGGDGV